MRPPAHMKIDGPRRTSSGIEYSVSLRWWWLWWLIARTVWRAIEVRPVMLKPAVWVWAMCRIVRSRAWRSEGC